MQRNTENHRRWRQALASAALGAAVQLGTSVLFLWLRRELGREGFLSAALLVLAIVNAASLIPLGFSLRQRYHEILGGEEDAARYY